MFRVAGVLGRYSNDRAVGARLAQVRRALTEAEGALSVPGSRQAAQWRSHALASRLDTAQTSLLVERYMSGEGSSTLARAFGLSENGVLAQLRRSGAKIRPLGKVTPAEVQEMARLRERGLTYKAIGDRYGITRASVAKRLAKSAG